MSLAEIIRSATSRAEVVRVRNALNPILWVCAVASPLCLGFSYLSATDPILHYGLAVVGILPIIAAVATHVYFVFADTDRLQSEEFVLRQQELTIIERKSGPSISLDAEPSDDPVVAIERKTIPSAERSE